MREYMISDRCGNSAAILPEKGATVVSFKKQGVEYLYRDDENLLSDERPRCGIPFLFPIFGRLKDGAPEAGTCFMNAQRLRNLILQYAAKKLFLLSNF